MKNSAAAKPQPPPGLSTTARKLWQQLKDEYLIQDPGGLVLLASAMQAHTRAERARAIIETQGEVVLDRWGQSKANPACAIERDARSSMMAALRALHLDASKAHPND